MGVAVGETGSDKVISSVQRPATSSGPAPTCRRVSISCIHTPRSRPSA